MVKSPLIIKDLQQIEFELTSRCNAGCPLCPRTVLHDDPNKELPISDINFDSMKEWMPKEFKHRVDFKLSGNIGDAGVHPKCDEIIKFLGSYGNRTSIKLHTNGGMRSAAFWQEMGQISYHANRTAGEENKFQFTTRFAIDGLDDTNHLYRIGTRFDIIMRNVEAYVTAGGTAEWHFIEFDHNTHQIDEAQRLAESMGVKFVQRLSVRNHQMKKATPHPALVEYKNVFKAVDAYKAGNPDQSVTDKILQLSKSVRCQHLRSPEAYVASNETLWPCCMLWNEYVSNGNRESWPEDPNWNNLKVNSMQDILNNEWYTNIETYWNTKHNNFIPECLRKCAHKGTFTTQFEERQKI